MSSAFTFDSEAIEKALRNIYSKEFNAMTDIEQNLFAEFWRKLNEATELGLEQSEWRELEADFINALRYNNGVFAAFKTHRLQNDITRLLVDENGNRRPFKEWLREARPIADHQCYNWFRTEWTTASNRAQIAANWKQFEAEADVLPNLEWLPSTAVDPRELHITFYGLILPIDHWFWIEHKPGDLWNCQCELQATAQERTPEDKIPVRRGAAFSEPAKGLENNPAADGALFSQTHPYIENAHQGAKESVRGFMQNQVTARMKTLRHIAKPLTEEQFEHPAFTNTLTISNRGIKEWLNQPHEQMYIKNELLLDLKNLIANSKYLGFGADKHQHNIKAHILETSIMARRSYIIAREFPNGQISIHSISDSDNILKIINK